MGTPGRSVHDPSLPAGGTEHLASPGTPVRRGGRFVSPGRTAPVPTGVLLLALLPCLLDPLPAAAQSSGDSVRVLRAFEGRSATFETATLRDMLERTRRLGRILEQDPDVLYYIGTGSTASDSVPASAYPWNVVRVRNDSVAEVAVPRNYREARRGYYNYAVRKMRRVRESPPAAGCDMAVEREADLVSAFLDGWIVTRTLYGGPGLAAVDAMVFARREGHLPAMVVALRDAEIRGCVDRWTGTHPDAMEAYRRWRASFWGARGTPKPPAPDSTPPDSIRVGPGDDEPVVPDSTPTPPGPGGE